MGQNIASAGGSALARRCEAEMPSGAARIRRTGWRGGTRPSGRLGRKVAQGSLSSSAQRRFLWK